MLLGLAVLGEMGTAVPHALRPPLAAAVVQWPCHASGSLSKSRGAFQRRVRVNLITVGDVQVAKVKAKNAKSRGPKKSVPRKTIEDSDEKHERCSFIRVWLCS